MRAIDTNILVYAHREEFPQYRKAVRLLRDLAVGGDPWGLPWPVVYEFLRVVTHRRFLDPPTIPSVAYHDVQALLGRPSVVLLSETDRHAEVIGRLLGKVEPRGNLVHDAHIASLLIEHGISEFLTADTDFHRFEGFRVVNPF